MAATASLGDAAERAGLRWALLVWVIVGVLLLVQDPGRMTFDTKLGVDIDPVGFYERLWHLWNPLEYLGSLQDQYIGYAFPMGTFYLLAHLLQVPVWVTERVWMSLLIAVGFLGLVRLAEAVGIGSRATRLLAGAAFALWPTFTILIGSSSGGLLPGLLAPWAVLPLIRAGSPRAAAARSGLVVVCMGGINAVSTLAVLVLPAMYILTRRGRGRWALGGWWVLAVLLATAWWAVPLLYQGRYGFNFLPYIEQAATTTQTMSAATVLRGSGNWVAYLNFGQPWLTAGSVMTESAWAVAPGRRGRRRGPGRARPPRPARGALAARHGRPGRAVCAGGLQRAARRPAVGAGADAAERDAGGAAQRLQDRAGAGGGAGAGDRACPGARRVAAAGWPAAVCVAAWRPSWPDWACPT